MFHRSAKIVGSLAVLATLALSAKSAIESPVKEKEPEEAVFAEVFQASADNGITDTWVDFTEDDRFIPLEPYYINGYVDYSTFPVESPFTPDKTKIATDWVEPEPIPVSQAVPEISEETYYVTYQLPQYTPEEIAANILTPYKTPVNIDTGNFKMTYHPENMVEAVTTPHLDSLCNDHDLYQMARIINAEAGSMGDEAMRAVGTVIINRVWNTDHPNTVDGVIYESQQFSTCNTTKEPTEAAYAAAYDVIYNDYRSFPHYVDAFQSISEYYWSGYNPYMRFDLWSWGRHYKMFFSYKANKTILVEQ